MAVLNTIISASGKLGRKTVPARPDVLEGDIFYSVGGLTARKDPKKDVHLRWKSISKLNVGDVIQVEVLETDKADKPTSRTNAEKRIKRKC